METNMGNSELLYEVIDTLSDEEFTELLDTLDVAEKAEEVITEKEKAEAGVQETTETPVKEKLEQRKRLISEKLEEIAKKNEISERKKIIAEKLEAARKKKQIQEKLEVMRKRAKIQEKLEAIRKVKTNKVENSTKDDLKAKIQEKLEIAKKKKEIMERIKDLRNYSKK